MLKLIDKNLIDPTTLYGSWAGAYGNFQFMPSTIKSYAIDFDGYNKIELKTSLEDSLASAANYIKKIGWKKGQPCYFRVQLTKNVDKKYINTSARKISHKLKVSSWKKKGVLNFDGTDLQVGSAITMYASAGIVSATSFFGDGSNLEGVSSSGGAVLDITACLFI